MIFIIKSFWTIVFIFTIKMKTIVRKTLNNKKKKKKALSWKEWFPKDKKKLNKVGKKNQDLLHIINTNFSKWSNSTG